MSQVQLVQPVFTLAWAVLLLGEVKTPPVLVGGLAVVACAGLAVRVRLGPGAGNGRRTMIKNAWCATAGCPIRP